MSGEATGWVLRDGPRADDIDTNGERYGLAKARRLRAVLLTIADAANRDGRHAHPGQKAIIEGSLYGRSTIVATVNELITEGWVQVEQQGGGKLTTKEGVVGRATVYTVLVDRRTVQSVDGTSDPEEDATARRNMSTARFPGSTARSQGPDLQERDNNVLSNGFSNSSRSEGEDEKLTNGQRAQRILKDYIDDCDVRGRPRPPKPGMSANNIRSLLDAGYEVADVKHALIEAGTHTVPAMETAIRRRRESRERASGHVSYDPPAVRII